MFATYTTAAAKREFDQWSHHYDTGWLQKRFFRPSHDLLLSVLRPTDHQLLDIGCGTGVFAARVLEALPRASVCGLDLSDGMLRQAAARRDASAGRLHLVQGDSERLPFAEDSFDVVTCTHSFHHYPHQERVVAEMHRVLRPGGRLLIIDGDRDHPWGWLVFDVIVVAMEGAVRHLSRRSFREAYARAGFANVEQHRRGGFLPFCLTVGEAVKPARHQVLPAAA